VQRSAAGKDVRRVEEGLESRTCLDDRPASEGRCRYQTAQARAGTRAMADRDYSVQDSDVDLVADVERGFVLSPSACI